jgi:hypothetical protein
MDFTLDKYSKLLDAIEHNHYRILTIKEFLESDQPSNCVAIRHDVDRSIGQALDMAKLEADRKIKTSYYLRVTSSVFKTRFINMLAELGHEVGYHYETLCKANGNITNALNIFRDELETIRKYYPVKTVCMHGSPLCKWDNRDIWKYSKLSDFGLIGEAFLSIDYEKAYYFSDVGRSWEMGKYSIRDHVKCIPTEAPVRTTDDLSSFINLKGTYPILINVHPERWSNNFFVWGKSFVIDGLVRQAKKAIILMRRQ